MRTVDIEKWRGRRDPDVLDPRAMQFRAEPRKGCAGCLFDHQWSGVCRQAGEVAEKAGLPDCAQGFVYVAVEIDPRQLKILSEPVKGATETGSKQNQGE
jgi:hypothetical protein